MYYTHLRMNSCVQKYWVGSDFDTGRSTKKRTIKEVCWSETVNRTAELEGKMLMTDCDVFPYILHPVLNLHLALVAHPQNCYLRVGSGNARLL